jgi:RimJ/RimL family protein N-acetyltransferase
LTKVFQTMAGLSTVESVAFMRWPMDTSQVDAWADSAVVQGHRDRFIAFERSSMSVVGCSCLWRDPNEDAVGELGYWVVEDHRHQGLATELAAGTIAFGRSQLSLRRFIALTSIDNTASIRVLQKVGFRWAGLTEIEVGGGGRRLSHRFRLA